MNRVIIAAVVSLCCIPGSVAFPQEPAGRFDAIAFLGTLALNREWTEGAFVQPPNTVRAYIDSLYSNSELVAFTVRYSDSGRTGWRLWMDFDADRFRALRLVKVFAQKENPDSGLESYDKLVSWVEHLLAKKIMEKEKPGDVVAAWRWMARPDYKLTVKLVPDGSNSGSYLTVRLDRSPGK